MYKVKNGLLASSSVSELFQIKHSGYSLRNSDFNIPRFSTIRYGKHSLRYQGPLIIWLFRAQTIWQPCVQPSRF